MVDGSTMILEGLQVDVSMRYSRSLDYASTSLREAEASVGMTLCKLALYFLLRRTCTSKLITPF